MFLLVLCAPAGQSMAQQSDYNVQQSFENRYNDLRVKIDSASTTAELDSLNRGIDTFAQQYRDKREFLDKALYPETYEGRINNLRRLYQVAHDRVSTIQTQGVRISELQTAVTDLQVRLDTLTGERARLFDELQQSRRSESQLRESVRRLTSNLQANDRLVFSLLDSLFLPYDRNLEQASEVEKENVASSLERANVLRRVHQVASDNVRFLQATQLQAKDYANLLDQYQQFQNRWKGLSDKLQDVARAAERGGASGGGGKARGAKTAAAINVDRAQVDSTVSLWNGRLQSGIWSAIEKEFTGRGVTVNHFVDAPSFDASIRAYVAAAKEGTQDPEVFTDQVWKERIDKEWRDVLTRENMLGKTGYAALDKTVSELSQKKIDMKLILYIVLIVAIALAAWWFISRKPKSRTGTEPTA
jgi:predicted  nucleic acid-binding Zn-ribbon protein